MDTEALSVLGGAGRALENKESVFAIRGGVYMKKEELEAHLAALIRLENVGVLLGAGASAGSLGGKVVKELWELFCRGYSEDFNWLLAEGFVEKGQEPNVESLLDTIEVAILEWGRQKKIDNLNRLKEIRKSLHRTLFSAAILKSDWWKNPSVVDSTMRELWAHRTLLQRLTSSRQPGQPSPWIFTTNYDVAVEWAAESLDVKIFNGFEGLHNRRFSPHCFNLGLRNMLARGEARFGTYGIYLAKLHGSLTWRTSEDGQCYEEVSTSAIWPLLDDFLSNREGSLNGNCPVIYPSAAKYIDTVGFVLGELLRRFTDFLSKPQTALVTVGYSFGDSHLNQILLRALQNPTLQLVICLPETRLVNGKIEKNGTKNKWLEQLFNLESPQVTFICSGEKAYLNSVVGYFPEPAIFDEQSQKIKELLKSLHADSASKDN